MKDDRSYFYRVTIAYDGLDYKGWQQQPHRRGISDVLRQAIERTFNQACTIIGASRTDTGVHAVGQIARIQIKRAIEPDRFIQILNRTLPRDIVVTDLITCTDEFHPIYRVQRKTYRYYFSLLRPRPYAARYVWHVGYPIDLTKLRDALSLFIGTHDFRSFCTGKAVYSTVRTIDSIVLGYDYTYDAHTITFQGKSFLYHMIRRIVGAAIKSASYPDRDIQKLVAILAEKNACQTTLNAPAYGLHLYDIVYKP